MATMRNWKIEYRRGRWARAVGDDFTAYLKLGYDPASPRRVRAVEMVIVPPEGQPVTADLLRAVPMAEIDAHLAVLSGVTMRPINPADGPEETALAPAMALAHIGGYHPEALQRYFDETPPLPIGSLIPARPLLGSPPGGRLTDEYLGEVAQMYLAEVRARRPPAPAIAAAAGVPVRTVHRWVADARKRGILPEATRGRAG